MIRFDNISKQYAGTSRPALNSIDLEILRGEFVFLVGASGSGKSSCLRLILKEDKPTKGNIHVLGQNLNSISNRKVPYFRRNLGVVFQDFRLLPNKSVFDNVAFTLQVIGKSRGFIQEAVPDVLKMVGLAGKASRLPHELSGGEQQRVAIARAIINKPALLLADEPTGNLDPSTSAGIMGLLERINAGGTTVIMATHEAGIVDKMQRRVIELVSGQIVRDERQGGYGFTAAIPKQRDTAAELIVETEPPAENAQLPKADQPPVTHPAWPDAPERELAAAAKAAAEAVAAEAAAAAEAVAAQAVAAQAVAAQAVAAQSVPTQTSPVPTFSSDPVGSAMRATRPREASTPPPPVSASKAIGTDSVATQTGTRGKGAVENASAASSAGAKAATEASTNAETSGSPATSGIRLSDHFATRPAQPIERPASETTDSGPREDLQHRGDRGLTENGDGFTDESDDDIPVPLTLAEKLGLRAAGTAHDGTGEQNVGPTS